MFNQIFDAIEEWMRELLTGMISSNLDRMFTDVNQKTKIVQIKPDPFCTGSDRSILSERKLHGKTDVLPESYFKTLDPC